MRKILIILACLVSFPIFALKIPAVPKQYVSDFAHMLSPAVTQKLDLMLQKFNKETSNQILVATFPSLKGDSLDDFSIRLAQKWRPGTKKNNNGAILLIIKNDRKLRIEVGYGLESVLTDALSWQIIHDVITPRFKRGEYDEGVIAGVKAMMKASKGEYKLTNKQVSKQGLQAIDFGMGVMFIIFGLLSARIIGPLIAFMIAVVFLGGVIGCALWLVLMLLFNFLDYRQRNKHQGWRGYWGGPLMAFAFLNNRSGGGFFFGGGFGGGSSSGGGFSSGGGSFGGGGASGGW